MSELRAAAVIGGLQAEYGELMRYDAWYEERVRRLPGPDFVFGNPQEMPLPALVETLRRWSEPRDKSWYAYKMSVPSAQRAVAEALTRRSRARYEADDVLITTGAFAGLAASFRAICEPGDEVIYLSPPWFFYSGMIKAAGGVPVRVSVTPDSWDLDLDAIERAITPRTRGIIVNSPNNPTGRLYPRASLERLAALLGDASRRNGRPIVIVSDEAYSRILFDDRGYDSPADAYPYSIVVYTYGKQLLIPGERVGYVALPGAMPGVDREALRGGLLMAVLVGGWSFANAVLQYALPELEGISIDIPRLQRRRDRLVAGLRAAGYDVHVPDGTFYVMPKSPWPDDMLFAKRLADEAVYVLPGRLYELPGTFRLSVTASDEMIEQALPVLAAARGAVAGTGRYG